MTHFLNHELTFRSLDPRTPTALLTLCSRSSFLMHIQASLVLFCIRTSYHHYYLLSIKPPPTQAVQELNKYTLMLKLTGGARTPQKLLSQSGEINRVQTVDITSEKRSFNSMQMCSMSDCEGRSFMSAVIDGRTRKMEADFGVCCRVTDAGGGGPWNSGSLGLLNKLPGGGVCSVTCYHLMFWVTLLHLNLRCLSQMKAMQPGNNSSEGQDKNTST